MFKQRRYRERKTSGIIISLFILVIVVTMGFVLKQGLDHHMKNSEQDFHQEAILTVNANRTFLSKIVYNATTDFIEEDEVKPEIIESYFTDDHPFEYSQIKVHYGYSFKAVLDFNLYPYFVEDHQGKEVTIVISNFALYSPIYDHWYNTQMIIFKSENEITGFMEGNIGIINELNPVQENKEFHFYSALFLTSNTITKYYEKGDTLFTVDVNFSNPSNIQLDVTTEEAFVTEPKRLPLEVKCDTYQELGESEVLEFMELAKVAKETITATVTGYQIILDDQTKLIATTEEDLKNLEGQYEDREVVSIKLLVSSDEIPTLQTIELTDDLFDEDGNPLDLLLFNKTIAFTIYYSYPNSVHEHIHVDRITVLNSLK